MNIGVIGAGVAGLTSAHLLSKKHKVTLIEKQPDLGGRECRSSSGAPDASSPAGSAVAAAAVLTESLSAG